MTEENRQPDDAVSESPEADPNEADLTKADPPESDPNESGPNAAAPTDASDPPDASSIDGPAAAALSAAPSSNDAGLTMPGGGSVPTSTGGDALPPPPSFGRQMAQLVIIPAIIALSAIGLFWFFGNLASTEDKLEDQVKQLRQGSGYGNRLPAGVQDPRYKNRCLAAFNISQSIDKLEDAERRRWLNGELIDILENNVHRDDTELVTYLLIAIGRLGLERSPDEQTGLEIIVDHIRDDSGKIDNTTNTDDEKPNVDQVNQGVLMAVLSWPDREAAAVVIPDLIPLTTYTNPAVREVAVTAIGVLGKADEPDVIDALLEALRSTDAIYRESRWNAAAAMAVFNQPEGIEFVLETLLNREALADLPQDPTDSKRGSMNENAQDRVMLSTLAWAQRMTDEKIWARIKSLSENDPSVTIRNAATKLLEAHEKGTPGNP